MPTTQPSKDFAVGSRMSGSRAFVRGQVSVGPELPILWDADFLYGDPTVDGDDTYMLCEINASSVLPFPPGVPHALAEAVAARLRTS